MTTEEKAKAYDEALEQAKKFHTPDSNNSNLKAVLELIFPKLRESEDERIRKHLIEIVETYWGKTNEPGKAADLAWLEKQKEHQNNSDAREKALGRDLTFPQDKDKNLDEIAQDYVDGVKEYNPEPTWNLMQTAVCYGYHYCEQKEQKPAEWSEEDEENFKWFDKFFRAESIMLDGRDIPQDKYLWFKSLRPQPKHEWSEEDKTMINHIIEALPKWANGIITILPSQAEEYVKRLKSLRPSPSWRPTDEQMDALKELIDDANRAGWVTPGATELYEQLKML